MSITFSAIRSYTPREARETIRQGSYTQHTAGLASGFLQANLVVLSKIHALDFMRFCQRNSKPCPLVGVTDTGDPVFRTLGTDIDVRFDAPSYNIYRYGVLEEQTSSIDTLWTDELVGFALGCSFTFEHALLQNGIAVWHIAHDTIVPMFRTNIPLVPAGVFSGNMVVSMRTVPKDRIDEVIAISTRFPHAHGAPIHIGEPTNIGISDIENPDWGDPVPIEHGFVTCFWACGVTPQAVLHTAKLPLLITHTPGHMLITDVPEEAEVPVLYPNSAPN